MSNKNAGDPNYVFEIPSNVVVNLDCLDQKMTVPVSGWDSYTPTKAGCAHEWVDYNSGWTQYRYCSKCDIREDEYDKSLRWRRA